MNEKSTVLRIPSQGRKECSRTHLHLDLSYGQEKRRLNRQKCRTFYVITVPSKLQGLPNESLCSRYTRLF
jgi:hypothetical protein